METGSNTENVYHIDEYPALQKRVWLRRLNEKRIGQAAIHSDTTPITKLETPRPPTGAI